jgi:hypothetical protein
VIDITRLMKIQAAIPRFCQLFRGRDTFDAYVRGASWHDGKP